MPSRSRGPVRVFPLLLLSLLATPSARAAEPVTLEGTVTWSGERQLAVPTTVAPGATLVLEAGTVLRTEGEGQLVVAGALYALGTEAAPVRLLGSKETEAALIEANDGAAVIRLHRVEASGAKSAVTVRGGFLGITSSRFLGNDAALTLDLKATGEVRDVVLEKNQVGLSVGNSARARVVGLTAVGNRVGVGVHNSAELDLTASAFRENTAGYVQQNQCNVRIDGTAFEGNQVGADLRQTRRSPRIAFCTFRKNEAGVSASLFAHPFVDACDFRQNEVGFSADQFSGPFVRFSDFQGNGEAVRLDKKSNARLEGNLLRDNKVALFADYSSYPKVGGNRFQDNEWHVRLGIYQSSDWERRQGSRAIMMGTAKEAGTRNPFLMEGQVPPGEGIFSVAGNAFDAETAAEMAAGPDANLTRFWDGRDQGPVRYEGFGEGEYAVDVIQYEAKPPPAPAIAGLGAWVPFQERSEPADGGARPPAEFPSGADRKPAEQ